MKKTKEKGISLDECACIFGAGILLKHAQALQVEIPEIQAGNADIEYIHRARVASRRLRSAFPLFLSCLPKKKAVEWQKDMRSVTRSLGEARDTDVQIERLEKFLAGSPQKANRPGILRLILRLRQRRSRIQPAINKSLQQLSADRVLEQMIERFSKQTENSQQIPVFTANLYQHSSLSINTRLDEFLEYEPYIHQPEKIAELHEMRIRAKWLRYTMENFSTLYQDELRAPLQVIRKAQDLLGEIHDCDVWEEFPPRFLKKERKRMLDYYGHTRFFNRLAAGIEYFQQNRLEERQALYESFLENWQKWLDLDIWGNLRLSIQVQIPDPETIDPSSASQDNLQEQRYVKNHYPPNRFWLT